jgi:leader peptidase (prepilin peptidase)/N-methyltransferase
VGSFLNVVVYRVPAGVSIVKPASHCPRCQKPIRWYDNIPVLGWIVLGGRCRDCREPISPRYPIVEAVTMLLFLALGLFECHYGGVNLPARPATAAASGILPDWELAARGMCAYHLLLLCTLLPAALIAYDDHPVPIGVFIPALLVGLAAPAVWPWLHPVASGTGLGGWLGGLVDGLIGLMAGGLVGGLASFAFRPKLRTGLILGPGCVGLFLGWQAVVAVVIVTVAAHLLLIAAGLFLPRLRHIPPTAPLAAAAMAAILAWRPLVDRWPLLG